ncbi:MAG: helix-turn-helix domain-containing protein [Nitrososphaerota archaeon]|nr:helix-turn-helix domain-containing protein [Nitrososphaerota archaeon]
MMELRFVSGAESWETSLCQRFSAYVKILGVKSVDQDKRVAHFVDITTRDEAGAEAVSEWLRSSKDVSSIELTELAKGHLMGVVTANRCKVCGTLVASNLASFISSASTESDCTVGYRLFLNKDGVPKLLNLLSTSGVPYKVLGISQMTEDSDLTARQFKVLKAATEMGLYDYPRRITQDDLALKLGIGKSTLNEILRRAEKKVLGGFVGEQVALQRKD